ncbi:hypothetical protein M1590_02310 [Candidatus Marsarchaeota archaeon]|nr:hypothetical protein [Candidatus Marsarchaeota archaeon]
MHVKYGIAIVSAAMLILLIGTAWADVAMPWVSNVSVSTYNPAIQAPTFSPAVTESSGPGYWCTYISNFTPGTSQTITLLDQTFNIRLSLVGPNYLVALWINNQSYSALRYNHILLGTTGGINYTMILTNASYTPSAQSAAFSLCGRSILNYSVQNVTVEASSLKGDYNVSLHHSVYLNPKLLGAYVVLASNSTSNLTEAVHVSEYMGSVLASGYTMLSAFNVSVIPGNEIVSRITAAYQCAVPAARVQPFVLAGNKWEKIRQFSINASTCQASFSVAGDPVVGLFKFVGLPPITSIQTTVPYRLVQINNYSNPYAGIGAAINVYAIDVIGLIIAVIIVIAYVYWVKVRKSLRKIRRKTGRGGRHQVKRRGYAHEEAGL